MDFNAYWFPPLIYTVLLIIFFINDFVGKQLNTAVVRAFRLMTLWVILFCVQDFVWGLFDSGLIVNDRLFFIASSVFHVSTVITTFFWLYFVLVYLKVKPKVRNLALAIDGLLFILETFLVIYNCFTPIIFSIVDGVYVTEYFRKITFFNQYVVYLSTGIISLLFMIGILRRSNPEESEDTLLTVFIASLAPILLGIFQLLYPNAPFYSLGYFLACYLLHVRVISKNREHADKAAIFHAISKTYYSMHLIDLDADKATRYIESPILTGLIKEANGAQQMINRVIMGTANDDYRQLMLDFVNLKTLSERMVGKSSISCEFIGRNYGWTRLSFISIEADGDEQKQVMVCTEIIDTAKRQEISLIFKSNNDELTGLYNRAAFESEIKKLPETIDDDTLVLVAMDINGLKQVNDTFGHAAGDELINGAATCMKQCFSPYGKIFRTGGDEFFAIINASQRQIETVLRDFEDATLVWHGQMNDSLSVSFGSVTHNDVPSGNLRDMITLADERMYKHKADYYRKKGVNRRGQRDAHIALCALYTKILKINVSDDTFQIINMDISEKSSQKGYSDQISVWLHNFGKTGMVHPEDLDNYLRQTSLDYIRNYFAAGKTSLHIIYRRKIDQTFKQVMMEIVPANDNTADNQTYYLYVKNIDN